MRRVVVRGYDGFSPLKVGEPWLSLWRSASETCRSGDVSSIPGASLFFHGTPASTLDVAEEFSPAALAGADAERLFASMLATTWHEGLVKGVADIGELRAYFSLANAKLGGRGVLTSDVDAVIHTRRAVWIVDVKGFSIRKAAHWAEAVRGTDFGRLTRYAPDTGEVSWSNRIYDSSKHLRRKLAHLNRCSGCSQCDHDQTAFADLTGLPVYPLVVLMPFMDAYPMFIRGSTWANRVPIVTMGQFLSRLAHDARRRDGSGHRPGAPGVVPGLSAAVSGFTGTGWLGTS